MVLDAPIVIKLDVQTVSKRLGQQQRVGWGKSDVSPVCQHSGGVAETLDGHNGPHKSILSLQFYDTDTSRGFVWGYSFEISRGMGPVATALTGMKWGIVPWGADHHSAFRGLQDRVTSLYAICEDLPEEHNRVTLGPSLTDSNGIPAPRIEYTLSENSKRMLAHAIARGTEVMEAAGAKHIETASPHRIGWLAFAWNRADGHRSCAFRRE